MTEILINTDAFLAVLDALKQFDTEDIYKLVESKSILITIKECKNDSFRIKFTLYDEDTI